MHLLSWGAIVPLFLLGRAGLRPDSLGGLYEKVFLAAQLAWLTLAVVPAARLHLLREGAAENPGSHLRHGI